MGFNERSGFEALVRKNPNRATRWVVWVVSFYQYLTSGRAPVCRYVPSCSNYALDALEDYGLARGSWLTIRRLARCNPWGRKGWDPVPRLPADPSRQGTG